jgi:hypothetical protein
MTPRRGSATSPPTAIACRPRRVGIPRAPARPRATLSATALPRSATSPGRRRTAAPPREVGKKPANPWASRCSRQRGGGATTTTQWTTIRRGRRRTARPPPAEAVVRGGSWNSRATECRSATRRRARLLRCLHRLLRRLRLPLRPQRRRRQVIRRRGQYGDCPRIPPASLTPDAGPARHGPSWRGRSSAECGGCPRIARGAPIWNIPGGRG